MTLKRVFFKPVDERAKVPEQSHLNKEGIGESAGYDVWPLEDGCIQPGEKANIRLGFKTSFEAGYVAIIDDKSSIGNKCVMHLAGVIDSNFRGEWQLIMYNGGKETFYYKKEKALAQILFLEHESPAIINIGMDGELIESDRGEGMFGSTGK